MKRIRERRTLSQLARLVSGECSLRKGNLILTLFLLQILSGGIHAEKGARPDEIALNEAVKKSKGKSAEGTWSPALCEITREWAKVMAGRHRTSTAPQGHDRFSKGENSRSDRALAATQTMAASEVLASTYGFEKSLEEHAMSCVRGWLESPSHNPEVMYKHDYFCYSMEKSSDQKYYCIGLFTEKESNNLRRRRGDER